MLEAADLTESTTNEQCAAESHVGRKRRHHEFRRAVGTQDRPRRRAVVTARHQRFSGGEDLSNRCLEGFNGSEDDSVVHECHCLR